MIQFAGDPPFIHDHHTVAHIHDFGHFRGNQDHRQPPLCQIIDDGIDFRFCAHINAAGGFVQDQYPGIGGQPFGKQYLLLITAGQRGTVDAVGRRFNVQRFHPFVDDLLFFVAVHPQTGDKPGQNAHVR